MSCIIYNDGGYIFSIKYITIFPINIDDKTDIDIFKEDIKKTNTTCVLNSLGTILIVFIDFKVTKLSIEKKTNDINILTIIIFAFLIINRIKNVKYYYGKKNRSGNKIGI